MDDSQYLNVTSATQAHEQRGSSLPPSEWHESRALEKFDLYADRWQLTSRDSVNVGLLRALLPSPILRDGAIRTLAHLAETKSYGLCDGTARYMRYLLRFWKKPLGDQIPASAVASFRHHCRERDGHDEIMSSRIRPFLRKWYELGNPGVSRELVEQMADWKLSNREKGARANRLDPNEGPLMPDENLSFQALALTAYQQGACSLSDYANFRLASLGFRRPVQIAALKCKDMDDSRLEDPEPTQPPKRVLILKVPRAKAGRLWRENFRSIPLSADSWNLLALHRREVIRRFDEQLAALGLELQMQDRDLIHRELALFPAWISINTSLKTVTDLLANGRHADAVNHLREIAVSDIWHAYPKSNVNFPLDRIVAATGAVNRDGNPLQMFPYRFRYTAEFDMERQGYSPSVRAWNLDHDSTESLANYHTNGPDAAARLSKATALRMAPIVRMFQGKVVDHELDAEGGNDPDASRLFIHGVQEGATCAAKRGCGMTAIPRCCYSGCPHFRPWLDGPHEALLEELLEERELHFRILRPIDDRQMIEANDGLILGVIQVIRLCDARRQELSAKAEQAGNKKTSKGART